MRYSDPFNPAFDAMWDAVKPALDGIVKPANMITDMARWKASVLTKDLPELILSPDGFPGINLHASSGSARIPFKLTWLLATGNHDQSVVFDVTWRIIRAMSQWRTWLGPVEWPEGSGHNPYKKLDVLDATLGQSDEERNRGIRGWSSLLACQVDIILTGEL